MKNTKIVTAIKRLLEKLTMKEIIISGSTRMAVITVVSSLRPLQSKTNPQDVHEELSGLKFADKSQCKKIIIK